MILTDFQRYKLPTLESFFKKESLQKRIVFQNVINSNLN